MYVRPKGYDVCAVLVWNVLLRISLVCCPLRLRSGMVFVAGRLKNTHICVQFLELQLLKRARQKNTSISTQSTNSTQSTSENFCMFTVVKFCHRIKNS